VEFQKLSAHKKRIFITVAGIVALVLLFPLLQSGRAALAALADRSAAAAALSVGGLDTSYLNKKIPAQYTGIVQGWPQAPDTLWPETNTWERITGDYLRTVYKGDNGSKARFTPVAWLDSDYENIKVPTIGMPGYIGIVRDVDRKHECLTTMASALTVALSGADASAYTVVTDNAGTQTINLYRSEKQCFNSTTKQDMFLNHPNGRAGGSFWGNLTPNIDAIGLLDQQPSKQELGAAPGEKTFESMVHDSADTLTAMSEALKNGSKLPTYSYVDVKILVDKDGKKTFAPVDANCNDGTPAVTNPNRVCYTPANGLLTEYDAPAAFALIGESAYNRWHDQKYLNMAKDALTVLTSYNFNPLHEDLLAYGALASARMNAREGTHFDTDKILQWVFSWSSVRNWGMAQGNYGAYSVYGLFGDHGKVFVKGGFTTASALAPIIRYDHKYALPITKYLSFVAINSRYLYPEYVGPRELSTNAWLMESPSGIKKGLPYETLHANGPNGGPYLGGDPIEMGWGSLDLALYMGSYIGLMNALVVPTDNPAIPMFDLVRTDFGSNKQEYPTFSLYNPNSSVTNVKLSASEVRRRYPQYDLATYQLKEILTNTLITPSPVSNAEISIPVPAAGVVVVQFIPKGAAVPVVVAEPVTVVRPTEGQTITDRIVLLTASTSRAYTSVQFMVDGVAVGPADVSVPFQLTWNSATVAPGPHVISAVARNSSGATAKSSPRTIQVANSVAVATTTLAAPNPSPVAGTYTSAVTVAFKPTRGDFIRYTTDGSYPTCTTGKLYSDRFILSSTATVKSIACSSATSTTLYNPSKITVSNYVINLDTQPPTISVITPLANATVSGSVAIRAQAADLVGVTRVRFLVDGKYLPTVATTTPYRIVWDSKTVPDGVHTISAKARDANGNIGTSASITVRVQNGIVTPEQPQPDVLQPPLIFQSDTGWQ
jgi:hypothetical protein